MYSSLELTMGPSAPVAFASAFAQEPFLSETLSAINADPFQLEGLTSWSELASMEADSASVRTSSGTATPYQVYRSEFVGNELASFYPEHPELRSPEAWIMRAEDDPEQSPNRGTTPSTSVNSSELASPQEERTTLLKPAAEEPEEQVRERSQEYPESVQYAPVPEEMDYLASGQMEQGSSSSPQFVRRRAAVKATALISATYSRQLKEDGQDASFHLQGMSKSSKRKRQQEEDDGGDDPTQDLKKRRVSSRSGSKRAWPPADDDNDWQVGAAQETHRPNKRVRKSSSRKDKASGAPCPICSKWISREGDLNRHIKSKHKGEKHECGSCGALFTRSDALNRHQKKSCRP